MTEEPVARVGTLLRGTLSLYVLHAAVRGGLVEALAAAAGTPAEVAAAAGTDPEVTARMLRILAHVGAVAFDEAGVVTLTAFGRDLLPGFANARTLLLHGMELGGPSAAQFLASLRTGGQPFELAFGGGLFPHLAGDPEHSGLFDDMMTMGGLVAGGAYAEVFDRRGATVVVDVGGGNGHVLAALLAEHADLRGVLFDQPHVVVGAERELADAGVLDRVSCVGGSFFEDVPAGGDVYVLARILHDWSDADCTRILARVHAAMPPDGRLVLLEAELAEQPGDPADVANAFEDLTMLMMTGGRERTRAQYAALLEPAGFALRDVTALEALDGMPVLSAFEAQRTG